MNAICRLLCSVFFPMLIVACGYGGNVSDTGDGAAEAPSQEQLDSLKSFFRKCGADFEVGQRVDTLDCDEMEALVAQICHDMKLIAGVDSAALLYHNTLSSFIGKSRENVYMLSESPSQLPADERSIKRLHDPIEGYRASAFLVSGAGAALRFDHTDSDGDLNGERMKFYLVKENGLWNVVGGHMRCVKTMKGSFPEEMTLDMMCNLLTESLSDASDDSGRIELLNDLLCRKNIYFESEDVPSTVDVTDLIKIHVIGDIARVSSGYVIYGDYCDDRRKIGIREVKNGKLRRRICVALFHHAPSGWRIRRLVNPETADDYSR